MKVLSTVLALLPFALAATSPSTRYFKLKSHVLTPANPAFENLYLEPYHTSPAYNYATLYPQTAQDPGIIGYLNGTTEELAREEGNLLFEYSSPEDPPYGFVIDAVNATYNPIEINAGNGTQGIFIDQGVIKYHDPMSGGFYACNNTLLYGPAVQLFYKPKVIQTPGGCSDVELVVEYS